MKCKLLGLAAVICLTSACGTVSTVARDDRAVSRDLSRKGTYCNSIPRMYSGVSYDVCSLFAEPEPVHMWHSGWTPATAFGDIFLSGFLDTALLPYTAYKQIREGNIEIKKRPGG